MRGVRARWRSLASAVTVWLYCLQFKQAAASVLCYDCETPGCTDVTDCENFCIVGRMPKAEGMDLYYSGCTDDKNGCDVMLGDKDYPNATCMVCNSDWCNSTPSKNTGCTWTVTLIRLITIVFIVFIINQ